jgi:hypothetical protein
MINWPQLLVDEIARRRVILFLGSGVSKQSTGENEKRPPLWVEFLELGTNRCANNKQAKEIKKLIKTGDLLTSCELLKDALGGAWEELISEEFINPQYQASDVHRHIFNLDARLVVTQNFDKIYDTLAGAESHGTVITKSYSENDTANFIRRRQRVVLKAHGSIDSPGEMVFTRGDYARARHNHASFYALLDGLILTHTCLFLGCGMSDPDISMMLERAVQLHPSTVPHYMVMGGRLSPDLIKAYKKTMNIEVLQYNPNDNHAALVGALADLVIKVEACRDQMAISRDW